MMHSIKMVVFDMAGTTINENNLVYKTVQKAINDQGYPVTLDEVLQHGAGKEKHQAITDVLTATTTLNDVTTVADTAFSSFRAELEEAYETNTITSFAGMESFFSELRTHGIIVVLNTGYNRKIAVKLLGQLGWVRGKQFDELITADDVEKGRPHPDMIIKAMNDFKIDNPLTVLKAGDSDIDIQEGKNAGCGITVGVLSGAQQREQLEQANPDYILNHLTDLEPILLQ
ncbi:phosphonatase-like hydrolase [Niabella sp. 22666]|uniref:phosphonatase-like hydrolase n=1 Tax=Niabella sp. 22666 TaxID=3453954 RepID=UPI003F8491EC